MIARTLFLIVLLGSGFLVPVWIFAVVLCAYLFFLKGKSGFEVGIVGVLLDAYFLSIGVINFPIYTIVVSSALIIRTLIIPLLAIRV